MPIIYPLTRIPYENVQKIIIINPIAQIVQDARYFLTYDGTTTIAKLFDNLFVEFLPILISSLILITGLRYFLKKSDSFAENV